MIRLAWVVAAKEFRHMMHDRFTLLLTFGLPVFQLLLFGYALETNLRNVPTGILDHDQRPESRMLVRVLRSVPLFRIDATIDSEAQADLALRKGELRAVIEIPHGFTAGLVYGNKADLKLLVDGSDRALSNYVVLATNLISLQQSLEHGVQQQLPTRSEAGITVHTEFLFNGDASTATFLVPGLVAVLAQMITTLLLALSIVKEREAGTLSQMLVAKVGARGVIAGKTLAALLVGTGEAIALVLILRFIFGIQVSGSILSLAGVLPLLVLAPAGIGLLIAARAQHQAQALQLTYLIFLPSVLLSGFVFPRDLMPQPVQWLSALLPTTYSVDLVRGIVLRGMVPTLSLFAGIAIALVLISLGWFAAVRSVRNSWN